MHILIRFSVSAAPYSLPECLRFPNLCLMWSAPPSLRLGSDSAQVCSRLLTLFIHEFINPAAWRSHLFYCSFYLQNNLEKSGRRDAMDSPIVLTSTKIISNSQPNSRHPLAIFIQTHSQPGQSLRIYPTLLISLLAIPHFTTSGPEIHIANRKESLYLFHTGHNIWSPPASQQEEPAPCDSYPAAARDTRL